MNDPITLKLNADKYIMMALEEDITSEDISTNSVMPEYQKGEVQLILMPSPTADTPISDQLALGAVPLLSD